MTKRDKMKRLRNQCTINRVLERDSDIKSIPSLNVSGKVVTEDDKLADA